MINENLFVLLGMIEMLDSENVVDYNDDVWGIPDNVFFGVTEDLEDNDD